MLLSRKLLQRILGAMWLIDGLLQLQPQMFNMNLVNNAMQPILQGQPPLIGVNLQWIVSMMTQHLTATIEIPINITLIVVFVGLGIALLVAKEKRLHQVLTASLIISVVIWYLGQAFGMILTGMSTDFNSGLLLVVMAIACWPTVSFPSLIPVSNHFADEIQETARAAQPV